jgi:hypothetical protein
VVSWQDDGWRIAAQCGDHPAMQPQEGLRALPGGPLRGVEDVPGDHDRHQFRGSVLTLDVQRAHQPVEDGRLRRHIGAHVKVRQVNEQCHAADPASWPDYGLETHPGDKVERGQVAPVDAVRLDQRERFAQLEVVRRLGAEAHVPGQWHVEPKAKRDAGL